MVAMIAGTLATYEYLRRLVAASLLPEEEGARRRAILGLSEIRPSSWRDLAVAADHHGVAPLIAPALSLLRETVPETVPHATQLTIRALASRHRFAAHARERRIDALLAAFAQAQIDVLLLKGAALAHAVYDSPEQRPMLDVDLLIRAQDSGRAAELVRGLGYRFDGGLSSRFAGAWHHLPVARVEEAGFTVALELHTDVMSPDQRRRLTFADLSAAPRSMQRGGGPPAKALNHADMLLHLSRHSFDAGREVRLIHLCDLLLYRNAFAAEIDWAKLGREQPGIAVAIALARQVLAPLPEDLARPVAGLGRGIVPLAEIAAEQVSLLRKLDMMLRPPDFWLHGFYGVPPGGRLWPVRLFRHPLTLLSWLARRLRGRLSGAGHDAQSPSPVDAARG